MKKNKINYDMFDMGGLKMCSISFRKEIYSKSAILTSMEDFKKIFDSKLIESGDYFKVSIDVPKDHEYDISRLKNEFNNYVLAMQKNS